MMTMIDQTIADISALNRRLLAGSLFYDSHHGNNDSDQFFKNLRYFEFDPHEIIVLSLTSDGDDTVIGRLMTKGGKLYYFDFDLDDCKYSKLTEVKAQTKPDVTDSLRQAEYLEEVAAESLFKIGL